MLSLVCSFQLIDRCFRKRTLRRRSVFSSSAKSLNVSDSNSRLRAFMRAYKTVVCERLSVCLCGSIARRCRSVEKIQRGVTGLMTLEENFPRFFHEAVQ